MKKFKKVLSLLLALVMVCSIFSGCSKPDESPNESPSVETSVSEEDLTPIDVSIAMWNFADPVGNEVGERIMKKILDDFGINLKIISVTYADANEKLKMLAASDDLPDIFVSMGWDDKFTFKKYVDQELIREIPKEMYSKYKYVNQVMTKYEYEVMPDGKMYHFPREDNMFIDKNGNPISFFYRKDYAEKLGYTNLDKPMTIDEFTEFVKDLALKDPDGNGKKDTYGFSNGTDTGLGMFRDLVYPMFGYRPWVYANNAWQYGYISDASKEATKWLNQLYKEGVLDPEFVLTDQQTVREKMATGLTGVMIYNMNLGNAKMFREATWEKINPDKKIDDFIGFIPLPSMADGTKNSTPKTYWSATCVSSRVDDAKLDRILKLFDWLYGEEGLTYALWGEEGIDYKVENNVYTTLRTDAEGKPQQFMRSGPFALLSCTASWHLDGIPGSVDPTVTDWDKAADKVLKETYWTYNYPADFTKFLFTPELSKFDITQFVEGELINIIMKSDDVDADFEKLKATLYKDYNLKAVEDEVNAGAKEKGIIWTPYKK